MGVQDAIKTYDIIVNETGITECTILRGLMDLAAILGGVVGIKAAVNGWYASGSWLRWEPSRINFLFGETEMIPDDAYVAIHPTSADGSITTNGLSPKFSQTGEPYTFVTQWKFIKGLFLGDAAEGLGIPVEKWTGQPVSLWVVKGNFGALFEYTGPGLRTIPQWASTEALPVYSPPYHMLIP
jgi:hypothetical protein